MRLGDFDALKAEVALMFGDKTHITESVCELIDHAPTVEPEKAKESELIKAYTKGFDTGVETVRTKGEWIFHKDFNESCRYGCNQCRNLSNIPGNFCPNCGAKMQKEGAK